MNLVLTLSNPDLLPDTLRTRQIEFGKSGGTIGRNPDCDWVLDDPERFVSSQHAVIIAAKTGFELQDVSTNGTFLNDELVGKGNKKAIKTGDTIRIGRFIMIAQQRSEDGRVKGEVQNFSDPFELASNSDQAETLNSLEDLQQEENGIDTFLGGSPAPKGGQDIPTTRQQHSQGISDALPTVMVADSSAAIPEEWWQKGPENPTANTPDTQKPKLDPKSQSLDDLVPNMDTATPVVIDEKAAAYEKSFEAPAGAPKDLEEASSVVEAPKAKIEDIKIEDPKKDTPKAVEKNTEVKELEAIKPAPKAKPKLVKKLKPQAPKRPKKKEQEQALDDGEFTSAFLAELSLDPSNGDAYTGQVLGMIMREMLTGSLDLLSARSNFRSEMRMSTTMIGARENNPLKFSINYQDALGRLLKGENSGFMEPVEATAEMMLDLREHQLATVAGIQAGIKALLAAADPSNVSAGKNLLAIPSTLNKLKERHAALVEQSTERMDGVFWRAFGQAYEEAAQTARRNRVAE